LSDFLTIENGFYLSANENPSLPMTGSEGLKIATGQATYVALSATYSYNLDMPYSNCRKNTANILGTDSQYYKAALNITKYSRRLCLHVCLQYEFTVPKCNCSNPSLPLVNLNNDVDGENICSTLDKLECVMNVSHKFDAISLLDYCSDYCPIECDSISYATSKNIASYPTNFYFDVISKKPNFAEKFNGSKLTLDLFRESVAKVNIFYDHMMYTELIQRPVLSANDLVAAIGIFLDKVCGRGRGL
jgi:hypothetical protein